MYKDYTPNVLHICAENQPKIIVKDLPGEIYLVEALDSIPNDFRNVAPLIKAA